MPPRKRGNRTTPSQLNAAHTAPATSPAFLPVSSSELPPGMGNEILHTLRTMDERIVNSIWDMGWFSIKYGLDVFKHAVLLAQRPLSLILVLFALLIIVLRITQVLVPVILTPICNTPLVTRLLPICNDIPFSTKPPPLPDFSHLMTVEANFKKMSNETITSKTVAEQLADSRRAIRDLMGGIRRSQLESKDQLSNLFQAFVADLQSGQERLQEFGSHVVRAVDRVFAMDEYVLQGLEQANRENEIGTVAGVLKALVPFGPTASERSLAQRTEIERRWLLSTTTLAKYLNALTSEAAGIVWLVQKLEGDLYVIYDVIGRESDDIKGKADKVLAELWTRLGGNKQQLELFQSHKELLSNIHVFLNLASHYVTHTLVQLQQASKDLDDLRERAALPFGADDPSTPLEVHMSTVRKGANRLTPGGAQANQRENAHVAQRLGDVYF